MFIFASTLLFGYRQTPFNAAKVQNICYICKLYLIFCLLFVVLAFLLVEKFVYIIFLLYLCTLVRTRSAVGGRSVS